MLRVVLILFFLLPTLTYSQTWNKLKYEGVASLGLSNFLGELGGADGPGSDFLKDLELALTRGVTGVGLRYKLTRLTAIKGTINYAMVRGDDALTNNEVRNARNIHFRSPIIELATQFEYDFIKENNLYRHSRYRRSSFWNSVTAQAFIGIGVFWFNPKAKITINGKRSGRWLALHPYNTEGQGLQGRAKPYSRISVAIPIGVGFKYRINTFWSVGFEIGIRKTFTDYLDDVSTTYWSPDSLSKYYGEESALLSNPGGDNFAAFGVGQDNKLYAHQRGDPKDNDMYMFLLFNINKKLTKRRSFTPRLR